MLLKKARFLVIFSLLLITSCKSLVEHIREAQKERQIKPYSEIRKEQKQKKLEKKKKKIEVDFSDNIEKTTPRDTRKESVAPERKSSKYAHYEKKWGIKLNGNENEKLLKVIDSWLGVPYKYAGTTKKGVDCSGLTIAIYKEVYDIDLTRHSADIWRNSEPVKEKDLRDGDLVFFKIDFKNISHVGVYISNGNFVHSATSRGVMINNLNEEYYRKRFYTGGRIRK